MSPSPERPQGVPRPPVGTGSAAQGLNVTTDELEQWARAEIVTAAHTDPDGSQWWDTRVLPYQLADHLDRDGPRRR